MRTGAASGHPGYFHETAFFSSDEELLAVLVPFLRGGQEAGEPTLVMVGDDQARLVRDALGDTSGMDFTSGGGHYTNPAQTIADFRRRFAALVRRGATQIRVVGEVPHPGTGQAWERWARYEAAVNHAYDAFPLWGLCPYDVRITPDHVLEDVRRTHPHVAGADGSHRPNARFEEPRAFLAGRSAPPPDPLERERPLLERRDVSPARARTAVASALRGALSRDALDGLVLATSEAVTNAILHGRGPVVLRAWGRRGRALVTVADGGPGPADPLAGLLPHAHEPDGRGAGMGLWIANQLCSEVRVETRGGCTVRLLVDETRDGSSPLLV